ncbi:MAG TPA: CoA-binding protein [Solirubrobacteraceae bacterium]|nr:CoA-binding protein [Solirubrobacteraceae bacterium]
MDNSKNLATADPVAAVLEARSVALVGASPRPGSLGARMIEEVAKSPSRPRTYLVNPRYAEIGGSRCYPGLAGLPEPVDLALLAVPDAALEEQVRAAAPARRSSSAPPWTRRDSSAPDRDRLRD